MKILDGKGLAEEIRNEIALEVAEYIDAQGRSPHLAAVIVGDDPASHTYVRNKEKACQSVGIISSVYKHPTDISERELLDVIDFISNDDEVDGMIVQTPLPAHISPDRVIMHINPAKDVDGFHPMNIGKMILGQPTYLPATPYGIMKLFEKYNIETQGKNCVVVGRSSTVGTPMSILLSRKAKHGDCTVTLCHSRTKNLNAICKRADILIAAIGSPGFITEEMVKKNAVVVDVGIHRIADETRKSGFRLIGDVVFDEVAPKCSYITPVPKGVGPMTVTALLLNTMKAFKKEVH